MNQKDFEQILENACTQLTNEARQEIFKTSPQFENRVREVLRDLAAFDVSIEIDFNPHPQAFPDIAVGNFGVEVRFTLNDTWRSVANSVLETNREKEMIRASHEMEDALFVEYWGESIPPEQRIKRWLEKADALAQGWIPSKSLFLDGI